MSPALRTLVTGVSSGVCATRLRPCPRALEVRTAAGWRGLGTLWRLRRRATRSTRGGVGFPGGSGHGARVLSRARGSRPGRPFFLLPAALLRPADFQRGVSGNGGFAGKVCSGPRSARGLARGGRCKSSALHNVLVQAPAVAAPPLLCTVTRTPAASCASLPSAKKATQPPVRIEEAKRPVRRAVLVPSRYGPLSISSRGILHRPVLRAGRGAAKAGLPPPTDAYW